jgi:hypothetical protein
MSINERLVRFPSGDVEIAGRVGLLGDGDKLHPGVVFLHGGGESSKERFLPLQQYLCGREIASIAIDFRGVGASGGQFSDGSLANRFLDANAACNFFLKSVGADSGKLLLVAASMGAEVALALTEVRNDIKALILISPAAYPRSAYSMGLGKEFQKAIRKKDSWLDSLSFGRLASFVGPVMVVYGENDVVIPEGVKTIYKNSLKSTDQYEVIAGGSHLLLDFKGNELPATFIELRNKIDSFLDKALVPDKFTF